MVFLLVFALLVWLSLALYNKQFTPVATVTLYTDSVGNEMHPGADVMVRGVQVGEVRSISADGTGARLALAIQPGMVNQIPANVTAEMVPTTLFGERYVDLIMPAQPSAARLTAGSVITQDHSADAVELEKVLNNLLPLLQASEPDKLSITLTAIAQGLQGRGKELGQTLVQLNAYLRQVQPAPARPGHRHQAARRGRQDLQPGVAGPGPGPGRLHRHQPRRSCSERASFSALYSTLTTASDDLQRVPGRQLGQHHPACPPTAWPR